MPNNQAIHRWAIARVVFTDTAKVPAGVRREAWLDPENIRFNQCAISENNYREIMEAGGWSWSLDNPLIVLEMRDGTLISLDNRRLSAARQASNVSEFPVRILNETDEYFDYNRWIAAK